MAAAVCIFALLAPRHSGRAFDIVRMRPLSRIVAALFGLLTILAGVPVLLDGLLPIRSHGPNPSVVEVIVGLAICVTGLFVRRRARRTLTHPPTAL